MITEVPGEKNWNPKTTAAVTITQKKTLLIPVFKYARPTPCANHIDAVQLLDFISNLDQLQQQKIL